jgi:hypothetical protein
MKYFLVLPVLAAILVSGCTLQGGQITAGKGIVIENFEPDFSQIYSTESVQLALKVKNLGAVNGEVKKVELTGADWEGNQQCTPDITGGFLPAVPSEGITGETKTCTWEMKPKENEIPAGLSMTYHLIARVTYGYTTSTVKSITIGTSDELRNLQNAGGALPADTISTTSGPIAIDIISKSPVRVSDAGGFEFPIELKITNVGGGIACKTDQCKQDEWNKVTIAVTPSSGISIVDGCDEGEYSLWRGKDNTIVCRLKADSIAGGRQQKLITVTAKYGYIVDATTSVTVTGQ